MQAALLNAGLSHTHATGTTGEADLRRVVITGMGIVSSIGNNTQEVLSSLHEAKSGISHAAKYKELGFR
ncbi:beta-ketoacyl synthase N-terminal-like domain-containing protein, partial [Acinetobacter baumannii]